jgi:hypothetical protein
METVVLGLVFGILFLATYCLYLYGQLAKSRRDHRLDMLGYEKQAAHLLADLSLLRAKNNGAPKA